MDAYQNPTGRETDYVAPADTRSNQSKLLDAILEAKRGAVGRMREIDPSIGKAMNKFPATFDSASEFANYLRSVAEGQKIAMELQNGGQFHSLGHAAHYLQGPIRTEDIIRAATGVSSTIFPKEVLQMGMDAIRYGEIPMGNMASPVMLANPKLIQQIMESMKAANEYGG